MATINDNDIGRLAVLVGEYANRILKINKEIEGEKKVLIWLAPGIVGINSIFFFLVYLDPNPISVYLFLFILTLFLVVSWIFIVMRKRSFDNKPEEITIARKRLLPLARALSQYVEHGKLSEIRKLEFGIRLLEAEEALKLTKKYAKDNDKLIIKPDLSFLQPEIEN